ncbi:rhodanese-like domain-containing protein [Dongia sp.]|uniref:rhodanese-like domain-containing protein n=1 Tax=Dongia sp. TaxID=1977262 RepID=UPI0035AEC936
MPITKGIKQLLEEANDVVTAVDPADAIKRLGDAGTVFVDLRDPRELARDGKIPGAFHCPRGMLEFWVDPESPYFKPIFGEAKSFLFYCASGWRSALSAKTVQEMGLAPVAHLKGGFSAWKAMSGPVETREDS